MRALVDEVVDRLVADPAVTSVEWKTRSHDDAPGLRFVHPLVRTSVYRLLSPVAAVVFAAFFNFAAYFLTVAFPSLHKVAETVGKGLIAQDVVTPAVIFGALGGAMALWELERRRMAQERAHARSTGAAAP